MYFDFVDFSNLSRDFLHDPLKFKEPILKSDLKYIYMDLNLTKNETAKLLGCSVNWVKCHIDKYSFKKDNKTIAISQKNMNLRTIGVSNCMKLPHIAERCSKSFKQTLKIRKQEIVGKRKQTCMKNLGVDNPSKSKEVKEKKKNTCLKHFGETNAMKVEEVKEKAKNTMYARYGGFTFQSRSTTYESYKNTIREKYNADNAMQNKDVATKMSNTLRKNQEKYKQQSKEKYGVEYPAQLESVKQKILETKKCNGTFNTSNAEIEFAELLAKHFKVVKQYKSIEYPHACDFYLPELDLYIELNLHWTHGGAPFNPILETHQKQLSHFQNLAKEKDIYKIAVQVWTQRDVKKLQDAKNNNLNYLMFYDYKEAKKWLEELTK